MSTVTRRLVPVKMGPSPGTHPADLAVATGESLPQRTPRPAKGGVTPDDLLPATSHTAGKARRGAPPLGILRPPLALLDPPASSPPTAGARLTETNGPSSPSRRWPP